MNLENSANKLEHESSPYLQQHAHNLVNWYPWGEEAIELARKHDKPILLSIGYASCHWCHVMMHESFCDPEVAATMNRLFVNIKVDKQERPDLDKIYQTGYQLLMGQPGGWPLTIFLSPTTLIPFYGATYLPKNSQQDNMPDFVVLLHRLNETYYHQKERVNQQELHIRAIVEVISKLQPSNIAPLSKDLIRQAELALLQEFDPNNGGFGEATKFPNCPSLEFILHSTDTLTRHIALSTLNSMAQGGIYDQLSGGFFRYTVDSQWHIPHFEKMLYDNAQLLGIYAQAFKITKNNWYKEIVLETGTWLAETLLDPGSGGFFTAVDADSDGKEGLYYVWDVAEIKKTLSHEEFTAIKKYYHLDQKENFEHKWHLYINPVVPAPDPKVLFDIKQKLIQKRNSRIAPAIDTIILTGWNGLTIKGLSEAGLILNHKPFLELANNTIQFIEKNLFIEQQLYASWQQQQAKIPAFLDDYAFVIDGILIYINGDPNHKYIELCIKLAEKMIEDFYDPEYDGFFFTRHAAEKLFYRPKTFTDDSIPSGNGIACLVLLRLGMLVKNEYYLEIAKKTINSAQIFLNEAPEIHLNMCRAYTLLHNT